MNATETKYFAEIDDETYWIRVRAGSKVPSGAREISNIYDHVNEVGIAKLERGGSIAFTQDDQSFRALSAMFYDA
jgi:hypothetical protein